MRKLISHIAICITAILVIALCGCDDLGEYEDTAEYYDSFGSIVLINGATGKEESFDVAEHFYNEESRDNFVTGVLHAPYVYMAIPFKRDIDMDSLALYLHSDLDATLEISFYLTNEIPSMKSEEESQKEGKFNIPPKTAWIGDKTVHLKEGKWGSFVLETFSVMGESQKSIQIDSNENKYVVLLFKNNNLPLISDEENNTNSEAESQGASISMTNLLVRALYVGDDNEAEEGE